MPIFGAARPMQRLVLALSQYSFTSNSAEPTKLKIFFKKSALCQPTGGGWGWIACKTWVFLEQLANYMPLT